MPSVDDRVVRMEFDNASFERKIATTMQSLQKLNDSLKFQGGANGLAEVQQAIGKLEDSLRFTRGTQGVGDLQRSVNRVDFKTISDGIENVSKGFMAMGAVAFTVLNNITTKAITAGEQLVKSLSVAPIMDGFREYETNMTSIQTILANTASKGTTLDDVSAALDKLNVYSDQTIYNFGEMARNIGTFTAAGVDLETSVSSIKGIANIAAMSGSTSQQAATAMYQLSQAIAAGSVKLMDWNSVVNAGMGGEAFKSALFETQKAMGNVLNVPVDQTFTQWEDAGNSFRETLQDGWITADVLTTTLSAFTGDMTEEMLLLKGFNEQQALAILKQAAIAKAAATEVKTFTQLMETTKEAVGTGWADTFRLIIGNFTEAKALWTDVSNSVSGFINRMSNARNEMFEVWKFVGGREDLIAGLKASFSAVGEVLRTLGDAFRNIFPATTGLELASFTESFRKLAEALKPSADTLLKLDSIFTGFFSVLSIGWTIVKEGFKLFWDLAQSIKQAFGGKTADSLSSLGDSLYNLKLALVDGGKIHEFFVNLGKVLKVPINLLKAITDRMGFLEERIPSLKDTVSGMGSVWEFFGNALSKVKDALEDAWNSISAWFSELGDRISKSIETGNFDSVMKFVNAGLFGGLLALLAKFMKDGLKIDIGGGLFGKLGGALDELTNSLAAMQANLKSQALLNIAFAIAVLTASLLVLSLIDPVKLASALSAMAIGFGQLLASFSVMTKVVANPRVAAKFAIVTGGLIALSVAMLILSVAMKIMASMTWEEIAKGLVTTIGLIVALAAATKLLSSNPISFSIASAGIMAMALSLAVLTIPMKVFATMSWSQIARGLASVGGLLVAMAIGMRAMPNGLKVMTVGAGLLAVSTSLVIIAAAVSMFAVMEWESIAKGMAGIGGSLALIAVGLNAMPITTPILAAGLVAVGFALNEIALAVGIFAGMSWEEIAKGMVAMGGALGILAAGLWAIGQSGFAVAALPVAAIGLAMIGSVIKKFAHMEWDTITGGLQKLAVAFGGVAIIALILQNAAPAIAIFGASLIVLGGGIALIGFGINQLAMGLKTLNSLGAALPKTLKITVLAIIQLVPQMAAAMAQALVDFIEVFTDAAPAMVASISKLIGLIIDTLVDNLPKIYLLVVELMDYLIALVYEYGPQLIKTGIFLIVELLKGIRGKIERIVELVADILVNFLQAFRDEIPRVARELADTIIEYWTTAAYEIGRVATSLLVGVGKAFIKGMIAGVDEQTNGLMTKVLAIPGKVLGWIGDTLSTLWQKGVDFITGLWNGMVSAVTTVYTFYSELPGNILGYFADAINWLVQAGKDILQGLWDGVTNIWDGFWSWFSDIRTKLFNAFPSPGETLKWIGEQIFGGLWQGLKNVWEKIKEWVLDKVNWIKDKFKDALSIFSPSRVMMEIGEYTMEGLLIGMQNSWADLEKWVDKTDPGKTIADAFTINLSDIYNKISDLDEFAPTITPVLDLTGVRKDAAGIKSIMDGNTIGSNLSFKQAQIVLKDSKRPVEDPIKNDGDINGGIQFVQNIHAPDRLSASDIYRQTRNQITLAKEELKIP